MRPMRHDRLPLHADRESAVSHLIEYLLISSVLVILIIITVLTITPVFIDQPVNTLSDYAFIDIGNGVSTRIVDLYVIAPDYGNITSKFDIPDDVAGRGYFVEIFSDDSGDQLRVYRGRIERHVSLAGIGTTLGVAGNTTGHGLNIIEYQSEGY
jgi:hypothetical protein